jgi:hypothetical protein
MEELSRWILFSFRFRRLTLAHRHRLHLSKPQLDAGVIDLHIGKDAYSNKIGVFA